MNSGFFSTFFPKKLTREQQVQLNGFKEKWKSECKIPDEFICFLTNELLTEPVTAPCGCGCNKSALKAQEGEKILCQKHKETFEKNKYIEHKELNNVLHNFKSEHNKILLSIGNFSSLQPTELAQIHQQRKKHLHFVAECLKSRRFILANQTLKYDIQVAYNDIPPVFQCEITNDLFKNPRLTFQGEVYEDDDLKNWLGRSAETPSRLPLTVSELDMKSAPDLLKAQESVELMVIKFNNEREAFLAAATGEKDEGDVRALLTWYNQNKKTRAEELENIKESFRVKYLAKTFKKECLADNAAFKVIFNLPATEYPSSLKQLLIAYEDQFVGLLAGIEAIENENDLTAARAKRLELSAKSMAAQKEKLRQDFLQDAQEVKLIFQEHVPLDELKVLTQYNDESTRLLNSINEMKSLNDLTQGQVLRLELKERYKFVLDKQKLINDYNAWWRGANNYINEIINVFQSIGLNPNPPEFEERFEQQLFNTINRVSNDQELVAARAQVVVLQNALTDKKAKLRLEIEKSALKNEYRYMFDDLVDEAKKNSNTAFPEYVKFVQQVDADKNQFFQLIESFEHYSENTFQHYRKIKEDMIQKHQNAWKIAIAQRKVITDLKLDWNNAEHRNHWHKQVRGWCLAGVAVGPQPANSTTVPTRIAATMKVASNVANYDSVEAFVTALEEAKSAKPHWWNNPLSFMTRTQKTSELYSASLKNKYCPGR